MNNYYILSIIIGIIHKLYDDLYDNDLYKYFNILEENEEYVNELLKCLFILGFCVISIKFLYFYIFFVSINILLYLMKKNDYGPYEFSGLVSSVILIPFLNWKENEEYKKDIIFIFIIMTLCFIAEKCYDCEYSYKKLIMRTFYLFCAILILFINSKLNLLSNSINIIILFNIGYLLTSCIFQCILLKKNIKTQENKTITPTKNTNKKIKNNKKCKKK